MSDLMKLLLGGAATSLLAFVTHAIGGQPFVDNLDAQAKQALAAKDVPGASVAMDSDGSLSRVAVLSGNLHDRERHRAESAILNVPGIASVRKDSGDGAGSEPQAAIAECQSGVDKVLADNAIQFRSGSAYLSPASLRAIDAVAETVKGCEAVAEDMSVAVGSHTDSSGSAAINTSMSQARADAVAAALAERGISKSQITAEGFGSSKPKIEGDPANKANRRIEFSLSGQAETDAEGGE